MNKMEVLSSFAINIAASIALEIFNKSQRTVEKEIKKAFEKALKNWSQNASTRKNFRESLKLKLHRSIENPKTVTDLQSSAKDKFERDFYAEFDKAIAEFPNAFNYLKEIKDFERFKEQIASLSEIEKKVDGIEQKVDILIENNLPQSSYLLEEWKRQIALYKEDIEQLKPESSIKHLKALEDSFSIHKIQPSKSQRSYLEFLKAQCYELTGKTQEAYQSYIKAKNLSDFPLEIREKASVSYAKLGQIEQSLELAEEILKEDEFNPTAWAVKVIHSEEPDLAKRFENIPDIVKINSTFQRIVYFKTITDTKVQNKLPVYQDNGFFQDIFGYSQTPLRYSNYNDRLFFIETTVHQWISNYYFDFISRVVLNRSALEKIHQILADFLDQLSNSEIRANEDVLSFYRYFLDHVLYGNSQALKTMESLLPKIKMQKDLLGVMLANCLQLSGEIDKALEVINSFENKSLEMHSLKLFCLRKKRDVQGYSKASSEFLNELTEINNLNCDILITIIDTLYDLKKLEDYDFEQFFRSLETTHPSLKLLALNFYRTLKGENSEEIRSELKSIEPEITSEDSNFRFYLPYCYSLLKEYGSAINCFDQYLSQEYESRDFRYYILALLESNENHKKLILALENWRKKCSFQEFFLKTEIELHQRLKNWNKCLEIAHFYLQNSPNDEWVLTAKILSINGLDLPNKKNSISENFEILKKQGISDFHHIQLVSNILIEVGDYQKAIDLLYDYAKDPENILARTTYFLAVTSVPNDFKKIPEIIEKDHHVKYFRKEKEEEIKIVEGSSIASRFLGKKIGDEFSLQDRFSKELDNIKILGIADKYQHLFAEILKQQESSPYSGLPFYSFELPSDDPEALKGKLMQLFGSDGSQKNESINKAISEYYDYQISLTEVIIRAFRSDFFGGYFDLSNKQKGIIQIPLSHYGNNHLSKQTQFVLDFSSLIILNQVTQNTCKIFPEKFIIANGLIQYIKSAIKKELAERKESLSVNITLESIEIQKNDEGRASRNISYYRSLLEWIDKNCEIAIGESKLDYESAINLEAGENNILFQLFIENIALVNEDENRVLLSDDHLYYKISPLANGQIISTEFYIKRNLNGNDEYIYELVKNRYIGLSIRKELLLSEYQKKIKGESNFYVNCLNNCSLRISNNLMSAKTVVEFLQDLALNQLIDKKTLSLESTNAFVVLLSGQVHQDIFKSISFLIVRKFQLLGEKYDVVKQSIQDAISIVRIQ